MVLSRRPRGWVAWLAAACMSVALLASAAPASAGEIVYQHGPDLWVMNEDGANQRPLITAAQIGASSLEWPSLDPSSGDLSFSGYVDSEGVCSDNCPGLYSYVGASLVRLSPAPYDCVNLVDFECGSEDGHPAATTANGRVVYQHAFFLDDYLGPVGGFSYEDRALNGSGEATPWKFPSEAPHGGGGEGLEASDPVEPSTIAYVGSGYCYDIKTDTGCEEGIVVDDSATEKPYIVSYDDEPQQAIAFSPAGQYVADIEVGEERGIWVYTNEDVNNPEDEGTWHGWWVLADPLQDSNDGGNPDQHTFGWVTITGSGQLVFDNGTNIYELPASCWAPSKGFTLTSGSLEPTCGTFGEPSSQAVQLTTDGTSTATDVHPTWTSASLTSYGTVSSTPTPSPAATSNAGGGAGTPVVTDEVGALALASSSVPSGKPLTVKVTLKAASRINVEILRYVPASGHGRHRKKAHYVLVETLSFSGKVGLNRLAISTKHDGHKLAPGKYEAKVSAGTGSHTVSFTIKG